MGRKWTEQELLEYNSAQIDEILKYKWIESEKRNQDIGLDCASMEWIQKYAHLFRAYWERSKAHRFKERMDTQFQSNK